MNTTFTIVMEYLIRRAILFTWSMICNIIELAYTIVRAIVRSFMVWTHICTTVTAELLSLLWLMVSDAARHQSRRVRTFPHDIPLRMNHQF